MTGVYLLHISPPYKHARHYLGYADDIGARVAAHRAGHGARLTQVAVDAGCILVLARMWPDTNRTFERTLKNRKHAPRLCPVCNQVHGQLDLLTSFTLADVEELAF
jgi:predicted GIY-YIG superfamily endonuclease